VLALDGWPDEDLLALAAEEHRIMVTFDVKDFPGIVGRVRAFVAGARAA